MRDEDEGGRNAGLALVQRATVVRAHLSFTMGDFISRLLLWLLDSDMYVASEYPTFVPALVELST
jgi:hypothetical protein